MNYYSNLPDFGSVALPSSQGFKINWWYVGSAILLIVGGIYYFFFRKKPPLVTVEKEEEETKPIEVMESRPFV